MPGSSLIFRLRGTQPPPAPAQPNYLLPYNTVTGWLVADGIAKWSDLPATWAGWTSWNLMPKSPIQYIRAIDVGVRAQFVPLVTVVCDGTPVIEEQHSDDDELYTSYAVITSAPLTTRYLRIRVTVAGPYPKIKSMRIILSATPVVEIIEDQNSALLTGAFRIGVGDIRVPITKAYNIIKKVDITLQSVGPGWSWELLDKDKTVGPHIKIYNAANALADAVFDATVTGI